MDAQRSGRGRGAPAAGAGGTAASCKGCTRWRSGRLARCCCLINVSQACKGPWRAWLLGSQSPMAPQTTNQRAAAAPLSAAGVPGCRPQSRDQRAHWAPGTRIVPTGYRPDRCRRRRHHGRDDHCCSGPGVLGAALSCAWASRKGAQARRARAGGPRAGARRCRRPPGGAAGPGRWAAPVCLLTNAVLLTCRGKPARRVCQPLTAPACPATCRRGGGGPAGGRRPC